MPAANCVASNATGVYSKCAIGEKYIPQVEVTELPNIILETIVSLNEITPYTGQLIQIARDGKITDD